MLIVFIVDFQFPWLVLIHVYFAAQFRIQGVRQITAPSVKSRQIGSAFRMTTVYTFPKTNVNMCDPIRVVHSSES